MKVFDVLVNHPISPSAFVYGPPSDAEGLCFIWLDEILHSSNDYLNQIIEPSPWNFFQNISQCLSFIEIQLRERNRIYLVASGLLGHELFTYVHRLMSAISFVYIYCSHIDLYDKWIRCHPQIKRVFNDLLQLGKQITTDIQQENRIQSETNQIPSKQFTITPLWMVKYDHISNRIVTLL